MGERSNAITQAPRPQDASGPLVVGRIYQVTEIRSRVLQAGNRIQWIPVIGPFHDDAEFIGFSDRHWHIDYRFISNDLYREMEHYCRLRADQHIIHPVYNLVVTSVCPTGLRPLALDGYEVGPGQQLTNNDTGETVTVPRRTWMRQARRRCRRTYPPYPYGRPQWMPELERAYRNHRLQEGNVCPHRGAPLGGLQEDESGNVTCPLHGLRWNKHTGRLAPRPAPDRPMEIEERELI